MKYKIKRAYRRGRTPCANCQSSKHERCRPKLDGTLCTCTCEQAELTRLHVRWYMDENKNEGKPEPTLSEALKVIGKRYKQA